LFVYEYLISIHKGTVLFFTLLPIKIICTTSFSQGIEEYSELTEQEESEAALVALNKALIGAVLMDLSRLSALKCLMHWKKPKKPSTYVRKV